MPAAAASGPQADGPSHSQPLPGGGNIEVSAPEEIEREGRRETVKGGGKSKIDPGAHG